ncbi:MAG: creatininase family protein [Planctomycetes bacterium]|nr:creatininase family protein [Planctomycetota bacterium]
MTRRTVFRKDNADQGQARKSKFKAVEDKTVWFSRPWHLLTESSGMGDPTGATAEKGDIFIEAIVEKLAEFLKELSDAEMDDNFPD